MTALFGDINQAPIAAIRAMPLISSGMPIGRKRGVRALGRQQQSVESEDAAGQADERVEGRIAPHHLQQGTEGTRQREDDEGGCAGRRP